MTDAQAMLDNARSLVAEMERLRGQVARVRALAAQWSDSDERTWVSNLGDELYTALAEPEGKS